MKKVKILLVFSTVFSFIGFAYYFYLDLTNVDTAVSVYLTSDEYTMVRSEEKIGYFNRKPKIFVIEDEDMLLNIYNENGFIAKDILLKGSKVNELDVTIPFNTKDVIYELKLIVWL